MQNKIKLKVDCLDIYNLALYNNSISLIDEIKIINESDNDLKNIELEISSEPSFFGDFIKKIDNISSSRYVLITPHDLEVDLTKVMYSAAPTNATISIKLKNMGEVISEITKAITLLPYDYIPSLSEYTEIISAFVTPEQEEVKSIVPLVLDSLKKEHNVPINQDMWDYSDKKVTIPLIKSIYSAICNLKITFDASNYNEIKATKLRLAESVIQQRKGTGVEIALLTASVAEYLGINTFIVFTQEKVLLGFFFGKITFDTCISDDHRSFKNLVDGMCDNFAIVDTTSMINGTSVSFESSSLTAQKALNSCEFSIVIDINRCRNSGYLPLPSRSKQNGNLIFEVSPNSKKAQKTNNLFKSVDLFCKEIKAGISDKSTNNSLISLNNKSTLFLIGGGKLLAGKLMFNSKVYLKSFPLENNYSEDFLEKIARLNQNIDKTDISGVVSTFNDKRSINDIISNIMLKSKDELSEVCLSFGLISYKLNESVNCAPLFISNVILENDAKENYSIKINADNFKINPCLTDILKSLYVEFDAQKYENDFLNSYDSFLDDLEKAVEENFDVKVYDVSGLSVFKTGNHSLIKLVSPEYFSKSAFLNQAFSDNRIPNSDGALSSVVDLPFSLDSSQQKAINSSEINLCTVIEGPNGSGKTLCSAAIAFSALRRGEKVLYLSNSSNVNSFMQFASDAGFDNHIMRIYDNEKNINTFNSLNTLHFAKDTTDDLNKEKEKLSKNISRKNAYYESLHNVKEIGFSLYEAVSQYERYRSFPYSVPFSNEEISKLTRNDVVTWFDAISSLAKSGSDCKEPHANPLFFVKAKDFTYDLKSKAAISLNKHISTAKNFIAAQNAVSEYFGIEIPIMREEQTEALLKTAEMALKNTEKIYYGCFACKDTNDAFNKINNVILHCDDIFELKNFLKANFTQDVINLDCDNLLAEWRSANSKFAFSKASALTSVKNKLKSYSLNSKFITNDNFVEIITKLVRYKNGLNLIEENSKIIFEMTGIDVKTRLESGDEKTFDLIKEIIETSGVFLSYIDYIYESEQKPSMVYSHCFNIFKNSSRIKSDLPSIFNDFKNLLNDYKESESEVVSSLELDVKKAKEQNSKIWYYFVIQFFEKMLDSIDLLKYWCKWNIEKDRCYNLGLKNVVDLYESEQLTSGDIKNAFLKGFFKSVSEYFLSCDDNMNNFSPGNQECDSDEFFDDIKAYRKLLKEDLNCKVCYNISDYVDNVLKIRKEEAEAILKTNFSFDILSNCSEESVSLLQSVKPCFVCNSPKFLTKFKHLPNFDCIIIDSDYKELAHAIFLLMPIAQRIVYTQSQTSIMGDCLCSAGASLIKLDWLYNSIFSNSLVNELFYNNSLSIIPLMNKQRTGINVINQLGNYDKKKTRVNVIEASATVDEIIKFMGDPSKKSIGVYTMTEEQRKLVELLLQKRLGAMTEKHIANKQLFIKSFLSAKHDPRDVIIFSTVLSEEEHSKYKQPITRTIPELSDDTSIECLINILTSVSGEFSLITSLSDESLDNFKTTEKNYSIFKKAIRRFFEETNSRIQEINVSNSTENSIVRQVAGFVETLGYKADLYVGCNRSKVDIAVKTKGSSNYLLGIVFDETAYINSDNYFGRNLILRNLKKIGNWNILRIHAVEWFENQNKQLDAIAEFLKNDSFENNISINA